MEQNNNKYLIKKEGIIIFQKTIFSALYSGTINPISSIIGAIYLQKIHQDNIEKGFYKKDGHKWVQCTYENLFEIYPVSNRTIKKTIKSLINKELICHKEPNWYRINYKKLQYLTDKWIKKQNTPTYKGLNKYSWDKLSLRRKI